MPSEEALGSVTEPYSGRSLRRREDQRFLTGKAVFTSDEQEPGALAAVIVRSPHAHAIIRGIATTAAAHSPGVRGVFTAEDLAELGPLPCVAHIKTAGALIAPRRYALARDRVRHAGDPVALIIADTKNQARDAAERLEVTYDVLPSVVDECAALALDAPRIWDEAPGNLAYRFVAGDAVKTTAALANAAHVTEMTLVNNRIVVTPIEPRAAIGRYSEATGTLHLTLTGQAVQELRRELAENVFHLPRERIQLRAPDVGGGFGMKNFLYPEWVLVLWAARRLKQPVRWVAERSEDFLSDTQGRGATTRARLGLDTQGRFVALSVDTIANLGAYLSGYAPGVATNMTAMGGVYAIPTFTANVRGAFTNTVPIDAYRGAGKPEANYLIERLVTQAARELGYDPLALRRRNVITRLPYRNAAGTLIEDGGFAENLEAAAVDAEYQTFANRRRDAKARGRLRGIGACCYLETARGAADAWAKIHFTADGTVELLLGTQSNGQGHETSFAAIAADIFGLPIECFRLVQADTERVPEGHGHGGARSLHMGGAALASAAHAVIAKSMKFAAHLLQVPPDMVHFANGRFSIEGRPDGAGIDLLALAGAVRDPANLSADVTPSLDAKVAHHCDRYTFPSGCHIAEVEVDPETGSVVIERYTSVDDFGRLINPMLTRGQVMGGVAQGIGQAMLEHTVYDGRSGQLLSGSLLDYALPRAGDLPPFAIHLIERPSSANPLGVKGVGQSGAIAAAQTVVCAVLDALAPLGVRHLDMPVTPRAVWRAIRAGRN